MCKWRQAQAFEISGCCHNTWIFRFSSHGLNPMLKRLDICFTILFTISVSVFLLPGIFWQANVASVFQWFVLFLSDVQCINCLLFQNWQIQPHIKIMPGLTQKGIILLLYYQNYNKFWSHDLSKLKRVSDCTHHSHYFPEEKIKNWDNFMELHLHQQTNISLKS